MTNDDRYTHVVVFDMNVPSVWPCADRCERKRDHLCRHRFGHNVLPVYRTKPLMQWKLPDLGVVRYVFTLMRAERRRWDDERSTFIKNEVRARTDKQTRWLLITYDKNFWDDARKEYGAEKKRGGGGDLEFVSNSYRPPGTIYYKNDVPRIGPPRKHQIERARVRGDRKEWVIGVVHGRMARLDIVVLKGASYEAKADVQLRDIFERMKRVF